MAMQRALASRQAHHHNHGVGGGGDGGGGSAAGDHQHLLGPLESALSCLYIVTPLAASVSVVLVVVALLTNQWLHTDEKMNNPSYNGTGDKDYLSKLTVSGLWWFCFTKPGETSYNCSTIDYMPKEEYNPDPNDSTLAIPYAVTKSIFFFAAASVLLLLAYFSCLLGYCIRKRGIYTFVSGVVFIISGLVMLFALIVYISVFKAEVGYKLRPRSQVQPPAFTYTYGYSFLLYVCGFICTQVAGISAIFLFINKAQYEYRVKHLEDLRRGKLPLRGGAVGGGGSNINYLPLDAGDHHAYYHPCQRHPQAYVNTNSIHVPTNYPPSPAHQHHQQQRRYFFSKEPRADSPPCSLHVIAKEAGAFYDFPPPPTISYQFDAGTLRAFPRDVTTHTVSTTADVIDDFGSTPDEHHRQHDHHQFDDYSPGVQHEHEFVTFDLDQPLPLRATQSTISINSRNGRSKDYANDAALRRTTPV